MILNEISILMNINLYKPLMASELMLKDELIHVEDSINISLISRTIKFKTKKIV
jgi:hypothetical protein